MQQQFLQVFRLAFTLIKVLVYIAFTVALGDDLSHVHSLIKTGIILAVVLAALAFFDPIVEIFLLVSLIALVVAIAHGGCSTPTIESGVRACVTDFGVTAFCAIADVIHRLLALIAPYCPPEIIETHLLIPPAPTTWS